MVSIQVGLVLVLKITMRGLGLVFGTTNIQLRCKQLREMVPGVIKLNSIENNYRIKKKEEKGQIRH